MHPEAPSDSWILRTQRIISLEPCAPSAPAGPEPDAVAIRGGRIAALGTVAHCRAELGADEGRAAPLVEVPDAVALPAFIDAHQHLCLAPLDPAGGDIALPFGSSVAELLARIAAFAARSTAGWVRATGYELPRLREGRVPTLEELDAIEPERPLLLVNANLHEGIANSAALARLGITPDTPDPAGGRIDRDRKGRPTGLLYEAAFYAAEARSRADLLAELGDEAWERAVLDRQAALLADGVVRVGDAAVPPEFDRRYLALAASGRLELVVHRMPISGPELHLPLLDAATRAERRFTGAAHEQVPLGAAKLFLDGGERCAMCLSARSLASGLLSTAGSALRGVPLTKLRELVAGEHQHWAGGRFYQGLRLIEPDAVRSIVAAQHAAGVPTAQHAVGNAAVATAIAAIEAAPPGPDATVRPRIEHVAVSDASLLDRIAAAGVTAVVQPRFVRQIGDRMCWAPPGPPLKVFAFRSMLDRGIELAGSSDWPVAPVAPLASVQAAVTRATDGGQRLAPEEAITAVEALAMWTRGSAAALGVAHETGTLRVGMRADIVLLSADPTQVAPNDIEHVRVVATIGAGRVLHGELPNSTRAGTQPS